MSILSDRLVDLRQAHGQSQSYVASKLGIKRSTLANYESGIREPTFTTLCAMADYYNVSTDYLLGRDENYTPPLTPGQQLLFMATADATEEEIIKAMRIIEALRG